MNRRKVVNTVCLTATIVALLAVFETSTLASTTEKVLHNFGAAGDGSAPYAGLVFDGQGNLYGTTAYGGYSDPPLYCEDGGCGIVFQLTPNRDGSWTENQIHVFQGTDGGYSQDPVVFDRRGNLYGAAQCGFQDCFLYTGGVVFQLIPDSNGSWTDHVLDGFADPGLQGSDPGGLAFDNAGRLYGTAGGGGQFADGVTFLLGQVSVFNWYEIVAHAFAGGNDGDNPGGPLTFDASGNIYGTTMDGGPHSAGIVYKLMPNHSSFGWSETILYEFTGSSDGSQPNGVIFDTAGNLFGTTSGGGSTGEGTVFELTPNSDGGWSESVLHSFAGGSDGAAPQSQVTFDTGGNLYGTTLRGGSGGAGTAFQLTPSGGQWSETVLYSFCGGSDGGSPYGEVILDNAGNLYGTASAGGAYGSGVAFEISR